jgi:hypothetical protein
MSREMAAKQLGGDAKRGQHGSRSEPFVAAFFKWLPCETGKSAILQTNAFTQASNYALDQQIGLEGTPTW